jgi:predicted esterase
MRRESVLGLGLAMASMLSVCAGYGQDGRRTAKAPAAATASANPQEVPVNTPGSSAKPKPPLALANPRAPDPMSDGKDLRKGPPDLLAAVAHELYNQKRYAEAVQILYYAVERGAHGAYNLACYSALNGQKDAAFYWLQKAALGEGIDADWANKDSDLDSLRKDRRWSRIAPFLKACSHYWENSGRSATSLVVPKNYRPGTPIDVVVGMHGLGADPRTFITSASYQKFADTLDVAFVGVSGTLPRGEQSFVWSEEPARDAQRIRQALEELSDKLTVAPGRLVAMGFSQGAQMAFEVAFANPSEYLGAIVFSPGTTKAVTLSELTAAPENVHQRYVCTCGENELPGNVQYTRRDAEFAKKAGSQVQLKLYKGASAHAFPADFKTAFQGWVQFVRGEGAARAAGPQRSGIRAKRPPGRPDRPRIGPNRLRNPNNQPQN